MTVVPSQAHLTDEGQLYYFNPVTVKSQVRPRAVVIVIGWPRHERTACESLAATDACGGGGGGGDSGSHPPRRLLVSRRRRCQR